VLGDEVVIDWNGRRVIAWAPARLTDREVNVTSQAVVRASERARQAVLAADQTLSPTWESLARLLLRAEGVASSYIEGIQAPAEDVAIADATGTGQAQRDGSRRI
jgi:phage shock protein A